jgi:hypothetical protein
VIEQIRGGKLRALAVTGADPSPALPDIPTLAQFVPSYEASAFNGVVAPKQTPIDIIYKFNAAVKYGSRGVRGTGAICAARYLSIDIIYKFNAAVKYGSRGVRGTGAICAARYLSSANDAG